MAELPNGSMKARGAIPRAPFLAATACRGGQRIPAAPRRRSRDESRCFGFGGARGGTADKRFSVGWARPTRRSFALRSDLLRAPAGKCRAIRPTTPAMALPNFSDIRLPRLIYLAKKISPADSPSRRKRAPATALSSGEVGLLNVMTASCALIHLALDNGRLGLATSTISTPASWRLP